MKKYLIFPIVAGALIFSGCTKTNDIEDEIVKDDNSSVAQLEENNEVNFVEETATEWKTYEDVKLGFSIDYPENWIIHRPKSLLNDAYWFSDSLVDNSLKRIVSISTGPEVENDSYNIIAYVKNKDVIKQKEAIIASIGNKFSNDIRTEERKSIIFNNKESIIFTVSVSGSEVEDWTSENIILEGDNYIYLIPVLENDNDGYLNEEMSALKNIHKTFKLLPVATSFSSEDVAYVFYNNYLGAVISGGEYFTKEDKDYLVENSPLLTQTFLSDYMNDSSSDTDPIICNSVYPKNLNYLSIESNMEVDNYKIFSVKISEESNPFYVTMVKGVNGWMINKVNCLSY